VYLTGTSTVSNSTIEKLADKNVYATSGECNSFCSKSVAKTTSTNAANIISNSKVSKADVDSLIKNPLQLDCEVLPLEVVKNDPVKINIINMPGWLRKALTDQTVRNTDFVYGN